MSTMHVFDPWGPYYLPPNYGETATSGSLTKFTTGDLKATKEFHTWREAVLQAIDVANLFTTASKPTVRWYLDRWVMAYTYRPVLMNGTS